MALLNWSSPVTGSGFCFCIWVFTKSKGSEKADARKPAIADEANV
jgi:hypothetical protein